MMTEKTEKENFKKKMCKTLSNGLPLLKRRGMKMIAFGLQCQCRKILEMFISVLTTRNILNKMNITNFRTLKVQCKEHFLHPKG